MIMLVSCRLDGLNNKYLLLTVLEVQKSKIKVSADSVRTLFLVCRQPASFFIFTGQAGRGERERQRQRHRDKERQTERRRGILCLFLLDTNLIHRIQRNTNVQVITNIYLDLHHFHQCISELFPLCISFPLGFPTIVERISLVSYNRSSPFNRS